MDVTPARAQMSITLDAVHEDQCSSRHWFVAAQAGDPDKARLGSASTRWQLPVLARFVQMPGSTCPSLQCAMCSTVSQAACLYWLARGGNHAGGLTLAQDVVSR